MTFLAAIRIFGVYTHAELENLRQFWTRVSKHLSKQGKLYKDRWDSRLIDLLDLRADLRFFFVRCTFRNKPRHAGDKNIAPKTFETDPLQGEEPDQLTASGTHPSEVDEPERPLTDLRDQHLEEVRSSSYRILL